MNAAVNGSSPVMTHIAPWTPSRMANSTAETASHTIIS
jgi:hypothetical protein